ncbi:thioredoxin-like protein [Gamsiella multidivaricata]|uniref:thioredoxin-like protein n=1 Tax=Gamsiella multidivaricata TaxID=101098 RepID=UPI00221F61B3|nr:thioredoxin-like protein [Gamsiella multidivaricata]KAI7818569.1 thioredoxin-like protein [Gamsiella multidivaricata]
MAPPKLTLYKCRYCPYAARAVLAMAETQQEHEAVEIDITVPRPDWYLKDINPYGQVPSLKIDDNHIILESLIVAEYIADLHPEVGLLPADPLQRAQARYLIHHWGARTQAAIHRATITLDPVEAAKLRQEVIVELEKVDVLLQNAVRSPSREHGPFFLGSKFTFADLAIAPLLARFFLVTAYQNDITYDEFEETLQENPKLKRFLEWRDAAEFIKGFYRKFLPKAE